MDGVEYHRHACSSRRSIEPVSACTPASKWALAGGWLSSLSFHVSCSTNREVMKISLIALAHVCAALCGCAVDASKSSDQANLQGTWLAQSESQNGQKRDVTYQYVFRGDKLSFKDETLATCWYPSGIGKEAAGTDSAEFRNGVGADFNSMAMPIPTPAPMGWGGGSLRVRG